MTQPNNESPFEAVARFARYAIAVIVSTSVAYLLGLALCLAILGLTYQPFQAGRIAAIDGKDISENPFTVEWMRLLWIDGYRMERASE